LDSGRVIAPYRELVIQALVGYPRDIAFEYRSADGRADRLQELVAELVQLRVDIVFAVGNQAIQAARQATSTIPIVMVGSDAVAAAERAEAIIVPGGPETLSHLPRIVDLASRARVPTIYGSSEFVDAGGLLAYGPSLPAMYRRAGAYLGKILIPTNPRDLPVE